MGFKLAHSSLGKYNGTKKHPLYRSWTGMWQRCYNPKDKDFCGYGAQNILVWEQFKNFHTFCEYMGDRPPGHTLDRIDSNRHYVPGNLKWSSAQEQSINRKKPTTNTSGYLGVHWNQNSGKWTVAIKINKFKIHLGYFDCKYEAALIYDQAVYDWYGLSYPQKFNFFKGGH